MESVEGSLVARWQALADRLLPADVSPTIASTTREEVMAAAAARRLPTDVLDRCLRPALALQHGRCMASADVPLGASHMGGMPHVPAGFVWPPSQAGVPHHFVVQLNLAECTAAFAARGIVHPLLPPDGWLVLFQTYDITDPRAVYIPANAPLDDLPRPGGTPSILVHARLLSPVPAWSVPDPRFVPPEFPESEDALKALYDAVPPLPGVLSKESIYRYNAHDRVLGYGTFYNEGYYRVTPTQSPADAAEGWELLAQIEERGGSDGVIYVWARRADLLAHRYDDIRAWWNFS